MDDNENNTPCNLDELAERMASNANKLAAKDKKMMLKTIRSDLELLKLNVDQLEILQDIYETINSNSLDDLENQREDLRRTELQLGIFKGIKTGIDKLTGVVKAATSEKARRTLANILIGFASIPAIVGGAIFQFGKEFTRLLKDTFTGKGVLGKIFNIFFKFPAVQIAKVINSFIQSVPILKKASDSIVSFATATSKIFNTAKKFVVKAGKFAFDAAVDFAKAIGRLFKSNGDGFIIETRRIIAKIGEGISDLYMALLNSARSFGGFTQSAQKSSNILLKIWEKVVEIFKAIAKISVNVGKLVGKVFFPLKIIIGAFEFITGALEAAGKQTGLLPKIIAGLLGGIGGLFGGLVGGTLDLFKWLTGFILGFLGKPGKAAKEFVNSFSFEDIIKDMFGFLTNIVMLFIPGGKSDFGASLGEATAKLKDALITKITGAFNTFIKDPIMGIFERIGAFFSGVKAFIGSIADQGITGLIKNGIGEVLDNANAEFEKARMASLSGSAGQKEAENDQVLNEGSKFVQAANAVKDTVTNVTNNIVNRGGDTVSNAQTNIGQSRRQRRGFNNDSGAAHN